MRTIIAGSFTCHHYADLLDAIAAAELVGITPTCVLSGHGVGVDQLGLKWGQEQGLNVLHYTRTMIHAGAMVMNADAAIVVWHNRDRDTERFIQQARAHGLPVAVWEI